MHSLFPTLLIIAVIMSLLILLYFVVFKDTIKEDPEFPHVMPEELDQAERDYYDHHSARSLKSCTVSFKGFSLLVLGYLFIHLIKLIYEWI